MSGGFLDDDYCAGCGGYIASASKTGVSGLYFPGDASILLCIPCYNREEDTVERAGTNDLPKLLARYLHTLADLDAD